MNKVLSEIRVVDDAEVPADFRVDDLEDGRVYTAYNQSGIKGFDCRCLLVYRHEERVLVVPYFLMRFHLNTMLPDGLLKRALSWVSFDVACVGHPVSELGRFEGEPSADLLEAVNAWLQRRTGLVAYKGFGPDLPVRGFVRVNGLPLAVLRTTPDYWSRMSSDRRNSLKRKLKKGASLRTEEVVDPSPLLAQQLYLLYEKTFERAAVKFERLTPAYFLKIGPISKFLLFYHEDRLIGFIQLLEKRPRMGLYYIGLDYERSQEFGLYFLFFLKAIEMCLRDGYEELVCGITTYDFKRFLGCEMLPTYVYYRHRNPVANWILSKVGFLLEPSEGELR